MPEDVPSNEPLAYLFKIVEGPSYKPDELIPTLRLLSERFTGELWSYGAYEADMQVARMRLRVVKDPTSNRIEELRALLASGDDAGRGSSVGKAIAFVVTSYDPFKGGCLAWRVARLLNGALCVRSERTVRRS